VQIILAIAMDVPVYDRYTHTHTHRERERERERDKETDEREDRGGMERHYICSSLSMIVFSQACCSLILTPCGGSRSSISLPHKMLTPSLVLIALQPTQGVSGDLEQAFGACIRLAFLKCTPSGQSCVSVLLCLSRSRNMPVALGKVVLGADEASCS
jgi:hypothetical protein